MALGVSKRTQNRGNGSSMAKRTVRLAVDCLLRSWKHALSVLKRRINARLPTRCLPQIGISAEREAPKTHRLFEPTGMPLPFRPAWWCGSPESNRDASGFKPPRYADSLQIRVM